jgi:hypothetical protein
LIFRPAPSFLIEEEEDGVGVGRRASGKKKGKTLKEKKTKRVTKPAKQQQQQTGVLNPRNTSRRREEEKPAQESITSPASIYTTAQYSSLLKERNLWATECSDELFFFRFWMRRELHRSVCCIPAAYADCA